MIDMLQTALRDGGVDGAKAVVPPVVADALEDSRSALEARPEQLLPQLVGRLMTSQDPDAIAFVEAARAVPGPWLRPITPFAALGDHRLGEVRHHSDFVGGLVCLPDGRVLSSSEDGRIHVMDAELNLLSTLRIHGAAVNHLAVNADGTRFASASDDHAVIVYDAATLEVVETLRHHRGYVSKVAFAGDTIVSVSRDSTVAFGGQRVTRVHKDWVYALGVSPDGSRAFTASIGGGMFIWDVAAAGVGRTLNADSTTTKVIGDMHIGPTRAGIHKAAPNAIRWYADDRAVSVGKDIVVWNTEDFTPVLQLDGHSWPVYEVLVHDGKLLTAGRALKIWDVQTGELLVQLVVHDDKQVRSMAISPDGHTLYTGGKEGRVRRWDLHGLLTAPPMMGHAGGMKAKLVVSDDQRFVLSGGNGDRSAILWSAETGRPVHAFREVHTDMFVDAVGFHEGRAITVARGEVILHDIETGEQSAKMKHRSSSYWFTSWLLLGDTLVAGAVSAGPTAWDLREGTWRKLSGQTVHNTQVVAVGEDRVLMASYRDRANPAALVDLASGKLVRHLGPETPLEKEYASAVCAHDGRLFVGTSKGRVAVFDADSLGRIDEITVDDERYLTRIWRLPDGRLAAYNGNPGTIWIVEKDGSITTRNPADKLWFAQITADGGRMVARDDDHTLVVIDLPSGEVSASFTFDQKVGAIGISDFTVAIGDDLGRVVVFRCLLRE